MERNDAITTLEVLKSNCSILSRDFQALKYAISSLKTDEAYQIMYEGEEIFTKDDMVTMLEELKTEIEGARVNTTMVQTEFSNDSSARFYNKGIRMATTKIQQKINALKGEQSGHTN